MSCSEILIFIHIFFLWNIHPRGHLLLLQRIQIWSQALIWQLPSTCNSSSMGPNACLWPPQAHLDTIQSQIKKSWKNWFSRLTLLKRIKIVDGLKDVHQLVSKWHDPGLVRWTSDDHNSVLSWCWRSNLGPCTHRKEHPWPGPPALSHKPLQKTGKQKGPVNVVWGHDPMSLVLKTEKWSCKSREVGDL